MNRKSQFSGFSKNLPMRRSNLYTTNFIKIENIWYVNEKGEAARERKKRDDSPESIAGYYSVAFDKHTARRKRLEKSGTGVEKMRKSVSWSAFFI